MATEGFVIKCLKCGREMKIPPSRVNEADSFSVEGMAFFVDVYETVNIRCDCGNDRD